MKIRNVALAGMTAAAVALAPVAAANAAENTTSNPAVVDAGGNTGDFTADLSSYLDQSKPGSSAWGDRYQGDREVKGIDLFGEQKNWDAQAEWARIAYGVTAFGVIGTVIGAIIAYFNQLKNVGAII
ncbi:hypothetical protein [Corynebacterium aquilae]|uniref:Or membrane protein n=1 Tax=Corynebacterium aquilae DSM 44791 TaxID=1431546 RepID=A0A1L7CIK6_9CORY|nr:hypothetical protein [Corynebacterium aquilae]APT85648.1 hypothetical protein CAQU_12035 [Corynebacterium aquilae DSM 44791]